MKNLFLLLLFFFPFSIYFLNKYIFIRIDKKNFYFLFSIFIILQVSLFLINKGNFIIINRQFFFLINIYLFLICFLYFIDQKISNNLIKFSFSIISFEIVLVFFNFNFLSHIFNSISNNLYYNLLFFYCLIVQKYFTKG
jgi:hypothetical protein